MYSSDDRDGTASVAASVFGEANPLAYVRPVSTEKGMGYGVFSADGTQLAIFASRDAAYFAAKQHDLDPVDIH